MGSLFLLRLLVFFTNRFPIVMVTADRNRRKSELPDEDEVLRSNGFQIGRELNAGSYSKVKHCTLKRNGGEASKHIVMKVINKTTAPADFLDKFLPRELDIIQKISHPNI